MRSQGKNNRQRGRNRRNGGGQINRNTTIDSNGPDIRIRGNAFQLYEKYTALGNDASAAGERITAEAYFQHADHYFRVHTAITGSADERRQAQPETAADAENSSEDQAQPANGEDRGKAGNGHDHEAEPGHANGKADETVALAGESVTAKTAAADVPSESRDQA